MADLVITESEVQATEGASTERVTASGAVGAGDAVYRKADGKWALAQADGTAVESGVGTGRGVAITPAADGQQFIVQLDKDLTVGASAAPAQGAVYVLSATAGGICPYADLDSGKRVTIVGVGKGGGVIAMGRGMNATGTTIP